MKKYDGWNTFKQNLFKQKKKKLGTWSDQT